MELGEIRSISMMSDSSSVEVEARSFVKLVTDSLFSAGGGGGSSRFSDSLWSGTGTGLLACFFCGP